jgi:Tfp pilus assembly protein PilF
MNSQLVKVRAGGQRGSGWAIGSLGILTARHVVEALVHDAKQECWVALDTQAGGSPVACSLAWHDAERDLALLAVQPEGKGAWLENAGDAEGLVLAEPGHDAVEAEAVGYPDAAVEDLPQPDPVQGVLLPAGRTANGRMPFDLSTAVPSESVLWKGMSGAGIRHGDRLLGVIVDVDPARTPARMLVSALPDPARDELFLAALEDVGARPILEAFDAPLARRLLDHLDDAGRPYEVGRIDDLRDLGVRLSRTDIDTRGNPFYPYVRRAVDDELQEALNRRVRGVDQRVVLIVGSAMSGKSRTGAEALRENAVITEWALLIPDRAVDLRELDDIISHEGAVLWLDDLDRYLPRIDRDLLRAWCARANLLVVATLRDDLVADLQNKPEFRSVWDLINDDRLIEQVRPRQWTEEDQAGLGDVDPATRQAVADGVPLGEVLGAADQLRLRLNAADDLQTALVSAIADWTRAGVDVPLPEEVLRDLVPMYLSKRDAELVRQQAPADQQERYERVISWATDGVVGTKTALVTKTARGMKAEDYIIGIRTASGAPVPEAVWDAALANVLEQANENPGTVFEVGLRAIVAGKNAVGKAAYRRLLTSHNPTAVAYASLNLGVVIIDEDPAEAQRLLEAAVASGEPELVSISQANLGWLLVRSDRARARELLEAALASGRPEAVPLAQLNLGGLLIDEDPPRGRELLEAALAAGDGPVVPVAAANLGKLLRYEDPARARELLEAALASGNPQAVPLGQLNLGVLELSEDPARGRQLLEAALASGNPHVVPLAQASLGWVLTTEDPTRARELLEAAVASGDPMAAPIAQLNLGAHLVGEDPARSRQLLEAALASGDAEATPIAQASLGWLLAREDPTRSRELLEAAVASGNPQAVPVAQLNLGALLLDEDPARSRTLFEAAASSGNPQAVPIAQGNLGYLLIAEDPDRARELLEAAVASGNPQAVPLAQSNLGRLLSYDDPPRARELLQAARTSGNPQAALISTFVLGLLFAQEGRGEDADALWRESANLGNTVAIVTLAEFAAKDGDADRALELLDTATQSGAGGADAYAQFLRGGADPESEAGKALVELAAAGDTDSMIFLGLSGSAGKRDDVTLSWLLVAQAAGDPVASVLVELLDVHPAEG